MARDELVDEIARIETDIEAIDETYVNMILLCLENGWVEDARRWDRARWAIKAALRKELIHLMAQVYL